MDRPCSIQIVGLLIIAAIVAALILHHLVFKRKHRTNRKNTMYYTEGIIDTIEIFGNTIRFSLLPTSGHLASRDDGKKALFFDSSSPNATMVAPDKNPSGKEIIWFSAGNELLDILLSVKNNRNTIWIWCDNPEKPELVDKASILPIPTIHAEGIRVF